MAQAAGSAAPQARIVRALVAPGHDGAAELVVCLRFADGGEDTVTLDADSAARLMARCDAQTADGLVGQSWEHLMHVLA
ncbi:MAG TPA: hypothetical protein VLA56_10900 [Pseudomonadales bacterium]|nr:hypothetical protein [Pseudomonadales bacterium]